MNVSKIALVSTSFLVGLGTIGCTSTQNSRSSEAYENESSSSEKSLELRTILFDFNRSNIRDDQQPHATAMANSMSDYLQNHPNAKFQVQGNTDDRGSVEYNMALGTRRANALKDYLVTSGVNPDSIDTVSYGKERPAVQGNDETAWAQNRRDNTVLLSE